MGTKALRVGALVTITMLHSLLPASADPRPPGRIVYVSDVDGDYEIFVMRADGTRPRQLTHNHVDEFSPSWSPDGRGIVFERERGEHGYEDLYIVDAAGGPARPWIRTGGIDEGEPAWSPNGKWIAFRGNDGGDGADVVAVRVDRSDGVIVSSQSENSTNSDPAWSPDGKRLALIESYDGSGLYVAELCCSDGYEKSEVTTSAGWMSDVEWSPDASCLAYTYEANEASYIYTIPPDGGEPRLVHSASAATVGSWSPDATEILFDSTAAGSWDVYTMQADGGGVRRLTRTRDVNEGDADWWAPPEAETVTPPCGGAEEQESTLLPPPE